MTARYVMAFLGQGGDAAQSSSHLRPRKLTPSTRLPSPAGRGRADRPPQASGPFPPVAALPVGPGLMPTRPPSLHGRLQMALQGGRQRLLPGHFRHHLCNPGPTPPPRLRPPR